MAEETSAAAMTAHDPAAWRGRWVSALALVAAIVLVALLGLVTVSRENREAALELERNTYEAIQLARSVDASIARAEAAMGRYVLDPERIGATQYVQEWRTASRQVGQLQELARVDAAQQQRVEELRRLFNLRGEELAAAARASSRQSAVAGVTLFYSVAQSETLQQLGAQLEAIVRAGRQMLGERVKSSQEAGDATELLNRWLGWLALFISALAIALSYWAYKAFNEGRIARLEAEMLEQAVQERTGELSEAYERLQVESAERIAAEEKLRQVQKMDAVGSLTGGIAHDFNNMLAVVVGGLDLAKRKINKAPDDAAQHLDSAMEGATRAAALTRRLLAFARAEPLLPEALGPGALVEGMRELIDRTIGERIRIHTTAPREDWRVWADPTGLENAILNLCVNARDAMPDGGDVAIAVENLILRQGEIGALPAGEFVRVSVTDQGTGIAPEHLERVFEPFFTTKPVGKGTGLGLSQLFGFVRQSGGDVTIRSALGEGTTVAILLPRATGAGAEMTAEPLLDTQEAFVPGPARILVVEDDPRVSRSTVTALAELGHRPVAVTSGREAIDLLARDGAFDLVVTDVVMPEMTGVELARELGSRHPLLHVLFVTGYVGEAGSMDELTGADLLRKPFTVSQLERAVAHALRPPRYETAAE